MLRACKFIPDRLMIWNPTRHGRDGHGHPCRGMIVPFLFENELRDQATEQAMADPQIGDRFSEMYCFWLYVVDRLGDWVTTLEASAPCELPEDGIQHSYLLKDFQTRFAYGSIPGYWIRLVDRGNDVTGWYKAP